MAGYWTLGLLRAARMKREAMPAVVRRVGVGLVRAHIECHAVRRTAGLARFGDDFMATRGQIGLDRSSPRKQTGNFAIDPDRDRKVPSDGGRSFDDKVSGGSRRDRWRGLNQGSEQHDDEA